MRRIRWPGVFAGSGVLLAAYLVYLVVSPLSYALLGPDRQGGFSTSIPLEGLLGETWPLVAFNATFLVLSNVATGMVSGRRSLSARELNGALAVVVAPITLLGLFFVLSIPRLLVYLLDGFAMDRGEGASNLLVLGLGGVLGGKLRGRPA